MIRSQEDDRLTDRNSIFNPSDIPRKAYRVTVEFPVFLIMIAATLTGSALSNIILYRTCVHSLGYSQEECKGFLSPVKTNYTINLEQEVQKYATFVTTVKSVLDSVGPTISSLFLGAWSDTYGRKPLITWSLFGMAFSSMLTVMYSTMDNLGPWWFILTAVPISSTGSFIAFFTASYCYISDVAPVDKRTLRMVLIDASMSAGMVLGSLIAKSLILTIGNVYLLLIGASLNVLAYSYACIFITESLTGALKGGFSKLFDILLVKELMRECFKKRSNNGKTQLFLLAAATMLSVFVMIGSMSLDYIYTRQKLHWSLSEYNMFSAAATSISFFGGLLGICVGQNLLGIGDLMFAMFTTSTAIADFIIKALAVSSWHMYLASAVSIFKGLSSSLIRSYLSKILPVEDISKVFTVMCAVEGIPPLIAPVIFTTIYRATIGTFPGAYLIMSAIITFTCVILLGLVKYYACRNNQVPYENVNENSESPTEDQ